MLPSRSVQTTPADGGTSPTHSNSGCKSVPRSRYGRHPRKGVQAPRTQAATSCETERASRGVGTDDARGRGYRPHALKQRLQKRPAGSVQTTPVEGGTGPTHSSSGGKSVPRGRYRRTRAEGVQAPCTQNGDKLLNTGGKSRGLDTSYTRGRGYRPLVLKQLPLGN